MEAVLSQSLPLFSHSLTTLQSKKWFVKTLWVNQCSPTSFPPSLQARVFNCLFQFHISKSTQTYPAIDTCIAQLISSTYFCSGDHVTTLTPPSIWLTHGTLSEFCCPENWDTIIKSKVHTYIIQIHHLLRNVLPIYTPTYLHAHILCVYLINILPSQIHLMWYRCH